MPDDDKGNHRSALVWTEHRPEKESVLHWDEDIFNAAIAERFPPEYGAVRLLGKCASYPLSLSHAHSYTGPRMALIADAAHGIHPIAGQGLNIGLRDVDALSDILIAAKKSGKDVGGDDVLRAYERARRADNMTMAAATDALNKLFSNKSASLRLMRRAGLRMVEKLPRTKKFFMRYAMGTGGLSAPSEKEKS
jgi:2-octaprenyl-6-methoxyphenol hydroxylase